MKLLYTFFIRNRINLWEIWYRLFFMFYDVLTCKRIHQNWRYISEIREEWTSIRHGGWNGTESHHFNVGENCTLSPKPARENRLVRSPGLRDRWDKLSSTLIFSSVPRLFEPSRNFTPGIATRALSLELLSSRRRQRRYRIIIQVE